MLKYKVKDIAHPMFQYSPEKLAQYGNVVPSWVDKDYSSPILRWLDYVSDADVVYPGPQFLYYYNKEQLDTVWEVLKTNIRFQFLKNKETGKVLCVCLSKFKPFDYKKKTMADLLADTTGDIVGVTDFEIHNTALKFKIKTYLTPTESTLTSLKSKGIESAEGVQLLEHAFIKKDIKIPIEADIYWNIPSRSVKVEFTKNKNPHIAVYGCYGNHRNDKDAALRHADSYTTAIYLKLALGNINLTDTGALVYRLAIGDNPMITVVEKDGRDLQVSEKVRVCRKDSNHSYVRVEDADFDTSHCEISERYVFTKEFLRECPKLKVDYDKVDKIIRRHQIV